MPTIACQRAKTPAECEKVIDALLISAYIAAVAELSVLIR
jgi:hypothetical protein